MRFRSLASRAMVGLFVGVPLLAGAGYLYETIAWSRDDQRHPAPGQTVDIGGYSLNVYCTGAGGPTVVLESGLGDGLEEWGRVQTGISEFARVCSYDRAGYGRSDAGPYPRTSDVIAEELHRLLQNAGEPPPYVLVGHSFGGYNVRVFHGRYPTEVTAMVLVDSTQEDQYRLLPSAWITLGAAMTARYLDQARWAPITIPLGVMRLRLWLQGIHVSSRVLQAKYLQARASELETIQVSAEQARSAGTLGAKPLLVLTAGKNMDSALSGGLSPQDLDSFERVWIDDLQMRLTALSQRGRRIILPNSGHDVPNEDPDAIVHAVRETIGAVRARPGVSK